MWKNHTSYWDSSLLTSFSNPSHSARFLNHTYKSQLRGLHPKNAAVRSWNDCLYQKSPTRSCQKVVIPSTSAFPTTQLLKILDIKHMDIDRPLTFMYKHPYTWDCTTYHCFPMEKSEWAFSQKQRLCLSLNPFPELHLGSGRKMPVRLISQYATYSENKLDGLSFFIQQICMLCLFLESTTFICVNVDILKHRERNPNNLT